MNFFFIRSLLQDTVTLDLDLVNFHMQENYVNGFIIVFLVSYRNIVYIKINH